MLYAFNLQSENPLLQATTLCSHTRNAWVFSVDGSRVFLYLDDDLPRPSLVLCGSEEHGEEAEVETESSQQKECPAHVELFHQCLQDRATTYCVHIQNTVYSAWDHVSRLQLLEHRSMQGVAYTASMPEGLRQQGMKDVNTHSINASMKLVLCTNTNCFIQYKQSHESASQ